MKKLLTSKAPYRRVVAQLNECEQRYARLVETSANADAPRLAASLAELQKQVALRRRLEIELLEAVEQERQRIGQDLHDDLCQRLSATSLAAGSAAKKISAHLPEIGKEVARISNQINAAIGSCRELAKGLNPVTLERAGLPAALEELGASVPFDVHFAWPRTKRIQLRSSIALHLYRIAEEAVANAVRHSEANRITIELGVSGKKISLIISDDGIGIDGNAESKGMGLRNMQYRANAIGGNFSVRNGNRGRGTRVECTLGYGDQQREND